MAEIPKYYQKKSGTFDIHNGVMISLEQKLADTLFFGDNSRFVYASDDKAFEKRVLECENGYDLPFLSYWRTNTEKDQERSVYGMNHSGLIDPSFGGMFKVVPIDITFEGSAFVNRFSDHTHMIQIIQEEFFDQIVETEIAYQVSHTVGQTTHDYNVLIPAFITLDSLDASPKYENSDFLEKGGMYALGFTFIVKTFFIRTDYDISLTKECILDFVRTRNMGNSALLNPDEVVSLIYDNPLEVIPEFVNEEELQRVSNSPEYENEVGLAGIIGKKLSF